MPVPFFAELALFVTLCTPGATPTAPDECHKEIPATWVSESVVEARDDWEQCQGQRSAQLARPGAKATDCKYTALAARRLD